MIVHLGNNGTFTAHQLDEMMPDPRAGSRVVFVNLKVPRDWQDPNNEVIAAGVRRYPNAVLVDWHSASTDRPELFWEDGMHLRPEGARSLRRSDRRSGGGTIGVSAWASPAYQTGCGYGEHGPCTDHGP